MECQASDIQRHPFRYDVTFVTAIAPSLTVILGLPLSKHGQGKGHHRHRPGTNMGIVALAFLELILSERTRAVTMSLRSC